MILSRQTLACALSALNVIHGSLRQPSAHFSLEVQRAHLAEVEGAQRELKMLLGLVMPEANWSMAPDWAMWWACNANNSACWYEFEPIILRGDPYWSARGGRSQYFHMLQELPLGVDWRLLKQDRLVVAGQEGKDE